MIKNEDGSSVTAETARQHGTDLLVAPWDAGLTVTAFTIRAPTLDEVSLAITATRGSTGT